MTMELLHDAAIARQHLAAQGWIARRSESFRHLPPPEAACWLGDAAASDQSADGGWRFEALPAARSAAVDARLVDATDPVQRLDLLATLPTPGDDEAAPFAWAHRALLREALRLRIAPAAGTTWLHLDYTPAAAVEAPLLALELQPGARCVLVETHRRSDAAPRVQNLQLHLRLAEGAQLQHLRLVQPGAADRVAHHLHATLERDAHYRQCLLATGSDYHLQRNVLDLQGERADAQLAGVLLAAGSALEQQVLARHAAPRTRSSAEVLALASGAARAVASAHSRIAAGCDEAETRQRLTGIPTGGQPRLVLRPHLEIHHDQVQAAHGATWGALPEDALFHARQRGLDEATAKAMILEGLARAVLGRAIDEASAPQLEAALAAAVAGHLARESEARHG